MILGYFVGSKLIGFQKDGVGAVPKSYEWTNELTEDECRDLYSGHEGSLDGEGSLVISDPVTPPDTSLNYTIHDTLMCNLFKTVLTDPPTDIDYRVLGLFKFEEYTDGEVTKVKYYKDYDTGTKVYSKQCVEEIVVHTKDSDNEFISKSKSITWIKNDGSTSMPKVVDKYYDHKKSLYKWGVKRKVIVDESNDIGADEIVATEVEPPTKKVALGRVSDIFSLNATELVQYNIGNCDPLIDSIETYDASVNNKWMDNDTGIDNGLGGTFKIKEHMADKLKKGKK